jgi:hypothetical protein
MCSPINPHNFFSPPFSLSRTPTSPACARTCGPTPRPSASAVGACCASNGTSPTRARRPGRWTRS